MADLVDKKPGDDLYAEEVTRVFRGTRIVEGLFASGGTGSNVGGKIHATQNRPYQLQLIEIVEQVEYQGDPVPDLYLGVLRFYKAGTTVLNDDWVSADPDGSMRWLVDTLGTDSKISVGDKVSAWWHPVRAAFIPIVSSGTRFAFATTTAAVAKTDTSFTVSNLWNVDGSPWTGDDPLTVTNNSWNAYRIANGARGLIMQYFASNLGELQERWCPLSFPPICDDGSSP